MQDQRLSFLSVAPLFLVLFIDGMGLGLSFPILNSIFLDPTSHFISVGSTSAWRDFMYGLVVSSFMLSWFFGAAILGDLSDSIGRKKSLTICLIGAFLGYLVSGIGIIQGSLTMLVGGRIIAGFTAGSQPIATAAIIDMSSPQHKARDIGLILLAVSLGFVVGPMLGGFLSNPEWVSWFNFSTPLYFAALISFVNVIMLQWFFTETFTDPKPLNLRFTHAINIFVAAFQHEKIRNLSVVFLVMIIGWSNYFAFFGMFLLKRFEFSAVGVSFFMALMAGGFSIGNAFLVDYCAHRYEKQRIIVTSFFAAGVAVILTLISPSEILVGFLTVAIGASVSVGYATILSVFSSAVDPHEQGWVMGVTGSIMALSFGVTSLVVGSIANTSTYLPLTLAAIPLVISGFMMASKRWVPATH